jgi:uncharacterized protein involved in outer membrane biogenesis
MKKLLIKIIVVLVIVLVVAVVAVTLSLGSIMKKGVETVGPLLTKTEMKLDSASLSLLSGSGSLKGFFVGNPEGYKTPSAVQVGAVSLGVKPMSVFSDKVHVTHVRVAAPQITFEGSLGGNNLSKILENVQAATGAGAGRDKKDEGASRKMQVDEFVIQGGKIQVSATVLGGKVLTLPLADIQLKDLGQGPEGITAAELTQRILSEVTANTLKAVQQGLSDVGKGAADAAGDAAKKKATESIGNLLKK